MVARAAAALARPRPPIPAFDQPLLDASGVGDEHRHQPARAERDQLDVPHQRAGERRVLHEGDLVGELGEQAHRAGEHVVEVDGLAEEGLDGLPLRAAQRT
jgi:hypothetical protein